MNYPTWYICYNAAEEEVWRGFCAEVGRTPGWSTVKIEGQPYSAHMPLETVIADVQTLYPHSKITFLDSMGAPTISRSGQSHPYNGEAPPATDEFVAPGCSLFSDPTKKAPMPQLEIKIIGVTGTAKSDQATIVNTAMRNLGAPEGSAEWRKMRPVYSGVVNYFPDALMEIAFVSYVGNLQHNGDVPLKWTRQKSADHPDCELRHLLERGTRDTDGTLHSAKRAWRALADLQIEIEESRKKQEIKS